MAQKEQDEIVSGDSSRVTNYNLNPSIGGLFGPFCLKIAVNIGVSVFNCSYG